MSEDGRLLELTVEVSAENVERFQQQIAHMRQSMEQAAGRVDWKNIAVLGVDRAVGHSRTVTLPAQEGNLGPSPLSAYWEVVGASENALQYEGIFQQIDDGLVGITRDELVHSYWQRLAALCTPSRNPITGSHVPDSIVGDWSYEVGPSEEDVRRFQETYRKVIEGDPESDKPFTGLSDIIDEHQYAIELPLAVELPVMEDEDVRS